MWYYVALETEEKKTVYICRYSIGCCSRDRGRDNILDKKKEEEIVAVRGYIKQDSSGLFHKGNRGDRQVSVVEKFQT